MSDTQEINNELNSEFENENTELVNSAEESQIQVKVVESSNEVENNWFRDTVETTNREENNDNISNNNVDNVENKNSYFNSDHYFDPIDFDFDESEFEISEQEAFEALKKAKGLEFNSIDDLLKPKESKKLSPEVEKFISFQEKTGNTNYNDFLATQKDWASEEKDTVIKEYLKIENPTLSQKQIDFLYDKNYSYDEDIDDDDVVMERSINVERDFQKGLKVLEERKSEYEVVKGFDENIPEEYKEAKSLVEKLQIEDEKSALLYEQGRNDFLEKTNSIFNDNFEGFKFNVGNHELVIKPENIQETKNLHSDIEKHFNSKYFDKETGKIIDPKGFHEALYFAMNKEKVVEHFFNLGKAALEEENDKLSKNITPDTRKNVIQSGVSNITVKVVEN